MANPIATPQIVKAFKMIAKGLESLGKDDDTMLVHVSKKEAAGLKERGGEGTKNKYTGLLQFDAEGGGEGPGGESGSGGGSGNAGGNGPGTGADTGGGGPSGQGGQGQTEHTAEKSEVAGPESFSGNPAGTPADTNTGSKGFLSSLFSSGPASIIGQLAADVLAGPVSAAKAGIGLIGSALGSGSASSGIGAVAGLGGVPSDTSSPSNSTASASPAPANGPAPGPGIGPATDGSSGGAVGPLAPLGPGVASNTNPFTSPFNLASPTTTRPDLSVPTNPATPAGPTNPLAPALQKPGIGLLGTTV